MSKKDILKAVNSKQMKKQQNLVKDITEEDGLNDVINSESAELKNKFDEAFKLLKNKKGGQNETKNRDGEKNEKEDEA